MDYVGYHKYIDEMLPVESPVLYGLHPNAEIDFLTVLSDNLFKTLLELQPRNLLAGEVTGQSTEEKVRYSVLQNPWVNSHNRNVKWIVTNTATVYVITRRRACYTVCAVVHTGPAQA